MRDVLMRCLLLAVLVLAGCARAYQKPPSSASAAERREVYERQKATYDWFNGVRVGGRQLPLSGRSYPFSVAKYYEAGGDTVSAKTAASAEPHYAWGLGVGLAGILGGLALQASQGWRTPPWFAIGALLGYGAEITLITIGNEKFVRPSVASYNGYLRQDLGLEGQIP